jgi:chromate transporter
VSSATTPSISLGRIAREWFTLGVTGFGGPPAHIALLRKLCVEKNEWIVHDEFEDAIATTNLLPGPASTQLAIYCAWRLRGFAGALIGALGFILPGLVLIIGLSALFFSSSPPHWVLGIAAGAGAGVPAIALFAAAQLAPASWQRATATTTTKWRWVTYAIIGVTTSIMAPQFVVFGMLACGLCEISLATSAQAAFPIALGKVAVLGSFTSIAWIALKVGALSYGGGFVIIPLMQHDVVSTYHWMTNAQFLNAVALGQITPGPVVQTVSAVGYAARGLTGALLAAAVAFTPSFLFVVGGGKHFQAIRANAKVTAFLRGAGPCVIGAILGSAVTLGAELAYWWQLPVLVAVALWIFSKRSAVLALVAAGGVGALVALTHLAI